LPMTSAVSKQLLPIYDKPMIYYPLSTLMLAGIREILIITNQSDLDNYQKLLGDGERFGIKLDYKIQDKPRGIADAFIVGRDFIGDEEVCLILGDNIFYGLGFVSLLRESANLKEGAKIFGYHVNNPENFGVIEIDRDSKPLSIVEKPKTPRSNWAVVGLYFFDNKVVDYAQEVKPSKRNELEITSVLDFYLKENSLVLEMLGRGFEWLDSGTPERLFTASQFIQSIQKSNDIKVACLEEIALNNGWLNKHKIEQLAVGMKGTEYADYLLSL